MGFVAGLGVVIGLIAFLVAVFPIAFWFVIVPILVIGVISIVGWLFK